MLEVEQVETGQDDVTAFLAANPRSHALHDEAEQVFWGGVTHAGRYWDPAGVYITHAKGAYKYDADGHEYIDYWMGHGSLLFGHAHPTLVEAVTEQVARGTHFGGNHAGEVRWAELICRLIPSAQKVRFFSSGTEATMMAMRLARLHTGRTKIMKFAGHFHGWHDYGAVAASGVAAPGVPTGVADTMLVLPTDIEVVEKTLASDPDIAAVILEADGAGWGAVPLPPGFLKRLRELTQAHGVVLIFDEIVSGFRYGPGGIQALENVTPDLTCLAKILAGGLPGGAVAGRAELLEPFSPGSQHAIIHHGTFNANPLSAAGGVATLNMIATPDAQTRIYDYIGNLGQRLRDGLNDAIEEAGLTGKGIVYGRGAVFLVLLGSQACAGLPLDGNLYDSAFAPQLSKLEIQTQLRQGMSKPLKTALRVALDNQRVQFMAGMGGFVSVMHTAADIDHTIEAFGVALHHLKRDEVV